MSQALTVAPAQPAEWEEAFRLFFAQVPSEHQEERVQNALHLVEQGELNPAGILIATEAGELRGVLVCLPLPGSSALLWPPQVQDGPAREATEDVLIRRAVSWLRRSGSRLGHALLLPQETAVAASLERNGFARITSLWYMQHYLASLPTASKPCVSLSYSSYQDLPDPALFHQTLLRTYEETLDCPEINGVRTIAEIMEGHRAQGKHDPSRWWLAHSGRDAVGVLLLTDLPECASWELAYVGVVPEARRRGFGRQLVARALSEAGTAGAARMTLSVDVRNQQAWNLYIDMGFEAFERREAYLAIWSPSHASKPVDLSRRDKLGCSPNLGDC